MRYVIDIRKASEKNNIHYYSVYKDNDDTDVVYYIGLDSLQKKIYFFESKNFENPACIYSQKDDCFEKKDDRILPLINYRVILKSLRTLTKNEYPQDISWEG